MTQYTDGFKEQMVRRMLGPNPISGHALSREVGVATSVLYRWRQLALSRALVKKDEKAKAEPTGGRTWTAREKLRVLGTVEHLEGEALGAFVRREGLHEEELKRWREAAAGALESAEAASSGALTAKGRRQLKVAQKQVKELQRELRRKEKALAEAAAMLMLEKKLQALGWDERYRHQGIEDDDSTEENEK